MKAKTPKKDDQKLSHALHNERACNYLSIQEEFADWIVTTSFYSALQFVTYKIFPFVMPAIGGKTTIIETLDQYTTYNERQGKKKHDFLSKLVAQHCTEIADDYDWLLSMSMNARYKNYMLDRTYIDRAKTLLKNIKKHCTK